MGAFSAAVLRRPLRFSTFERTASGREAAAIEKTTALTLCSQPTDATQRSARHAPPGDEQNQIGRLRRAFGVRRYRAETGSYRIPGRWIGLSPSAEIGAHAEASHDVMRQVTVTCTASPRSYPTEPCSVGKVLDYAADLNSDLYTPLQLQSLACKRRPDVGCRVQSRRCEFSYNSGTTAYSLSYIMRYINIQSETEAFGAFRKKTGEGY